LKVRNPDRESGKQNDSLKQEEPEETEPRGIELTDDSSLLNRILKNMSSRFSRILKDDGIEAAELWVLCCVFRIRWKSLKPEPKSPDFEAAVISPGRRS
jgi:hypothetical protein